MPNFIKTFVLILIVLLDFSCKKDGNDDTIPGNLQIIKAQTGDITLDPQVKVTNVPVDGKIIVEFGNKLDSLTVGANINLKKGETLISFSSIIFKDDYKLVELTPSKTLDYLSDYSLEITSKIKGFTGEVFPGVTYQFTTKNGVLTIENILLNGVSFLPPPTLKDIDPDQLRIEINFSHPLDATSYKNYFSVSGSASVSYELSNENKKVTISNSQSLKSWNRYFFNISSNLKSASGFDFSGFTNSFFTSMDSTLKFPLITDDELLTLVERQTFKFFWDYAHPVSGLTRERFGSGDVVTSGGSGFGLMAILVGIERNFITRQQGFEHIRKITNFLLNPATDKFHGVFPHWLNGATGKVIPFSTKDNGGDLVETSYLMQGLLTVKQYFLNGNAEEKALCDSIQKLWQNVEWSWYQKNNENRLYWHWSPNYNWDMNMPVSGWNEALIVYVLAASSPTHSISKEVYTNGWARNGAFPMKNGKTFYNIQLPLGEDYGGPLFFSHYSFLGLDPRKLADVYANYWEQNVNHATINYLYAVDNPRNYPGYSKDIWGLTASDNPGGYNAHSPTNDLGVISPTAAVSSIVYTPVQSMAAIRFFYYYLGDKLWGEYGYYDAFSVNEGWYATSYLAIDQGPIICMIENYRTQLLWKLFMKDMDVRNGLTKLGFSF